MPTPSLIDAHCHFDFPAFDADRLAQWRKARGQGVRALVIPGVREQHWGRVAKVAESCAGWWYCLGIHPWFVDEHDVGALDRLEGRFRSVAPRCLGLGECGLDALRGSLAAQQPWFDAQVDIAERHHQPLVIHSVKAHDQVHSTLRSRRWSGRALIHGFSGSYEQARKLVDLGCYVGVGGVITHPRARKTRAAVARIPVDALVLETDAPDMAPSGVSSGENSPRYLSRILEALAALKDMDSGVLAECLLNNTATLYGRSTESLLSPPGDDVRW